MSTIVTLLKQLGLNAYLPKTEPSPYTVGTIYALCLLPAAILLIFTLLDRRNQVLQPHGCRKLGLRTSSNLADEHAEKYATGTSANKSGTQWTVKSLWIYPVKGCKGVELNRGTTVATGMEYDRQFTFAQLKSPFPVSLDATETEKADHKWEFISQRSFPLLAQVKTEVWVPDPASPTYLPTRPEVQSGGVVVRFPYEEGGWKGVKARLTSALKFQVPELSFRIPFNPTEAQIQQKRFKTETLTIWKDTPPALNMTTCLPPELKYFLGVKNPLALFRVAATHPREVHRCAPHRDELGYQPITGFADAYPLHIANLASIHDVARKLEPSAPRLSVKQFRPNIIITGPEAYAEDTWKRIRIGEDEYHVSCRTARCKVPNVNQDTGVKHPVEPDKTLRRFRCVDAGAKNLACMGMQMVPAREEGKIRVGDRVEVLETGEHYYLVQ